MIAHRILLSGCVFALLAVPGVASASTRMTVPATVPAGKQGVLRVEADAGVKACTLTARRGKTTEGPFRVAVKTTDATVGWQVPSTAQRGRWTLSTRCGKAKPATAAITVKRTRKGGKPTLIKRGSVRLVRGATATPAKDCAAAWNAYASKRDARGYCSGYDTAYVASRMGDAYKGLGPAADWPKNAAARGLHVSPTLRPGVVAWWKPRNGRPARVGYIDGWETPTAVRVTEMNVHRWNQWTTRTFDANSKPGHNARPDLFIGPVPEPPPPPPQRQPLPTIQSQPPRGAGRTAEVILSNAVTGNPAIDAFYLLGYGADNVFRASYFNGIGGVRGSGDVDGDGRADLVALHPSGYFVARSNADGTFSHILTPVPIDPLDHALVLDANGDGKADVVTAEDPDQYVVALSNGDGTFTRGPAQPGRLYHSTAGDFTGDGKPDIYSQGIFWRGNGDGTFTTLPLSSRVSLWHSGEAAGDVNGDGKDDLVMSTQPGGPSPSGLYVALSNGDGSFAEAQRFADWQLLDYDLVTGDVDGDGHVDVVTHESAGGIVAHFGRGDLTFTRTVLSSTPGSTGLRAVADVDGR